MAEETSLVQPGFLLSKSRGVGGGGDKGRLSNSPSSVSTMKEAAAHYRGGSTGSFNGKSDEYCGEGRESHALRKPVKEIGGMVHLKDVGVNVAIKNKIVGNPKGLVDRRIVSPVKEKGKKEIVTDFEHVDMVTKQSGSDIMMSVTRESNITQDCDSSLHSEFKSGGENEKVFTEETSLDTNDLNLFKKSCDMSKGKPTLLRLPSRVSSGRIIDARISQTSDGNESVVKNDNNGSKSAGGVKSIEGSASSAVKKGLVKSRSLNLGTNVKDAGLVNIKNNGKSETPENQIAAAKTKILNMRPSRSLNPLAVKTSSLLQSKTSDDGQTGKKLDVKKVSKPDILSASSSSPSENMEKSSDIKKFSSVVRVLSSVRRPSKITKAAAAAAAAAPKELNDQGIQKDTEEHEKKSQTNTKMKMTSSKSLLAPSPSVTKTTVTSRTSYLPSRVKKSPEKTEQKLEAKATLQSGNQKPNKLKMRSTTTMPVDTTNRRNYLKKDNPSTAARRTNSEKLLPGRSSIRIEKITQGLSNKVIKETASRLIRTRNKSKVMALIGAFETVISIQKKSARVNISKGKKRISSSKTSR